MSSAPSTIIADRCSALESEPFTVETFIDDVKAAIRLKDDEERVLAVKRTLVSACREHPDFLPERFLQPSNGESYARRPLYIDPYGRFSILVMVWDKGQGTPLHDHGGAWVVECLYQGRMKVTDYDLDAVRGDVYHFTAGSTHHARPGEASHRTPPQEFHILENDQEAPSITVHVFGGLMPRCDIFEPMGEGFRRVPKELVYSA